jgi:hypothetical protein
MPSTLNTYYHLSANILSPGTVLESRFGVSPREQNLYAIIRSALIDGPLVLKSILLNDAMNNKDPFLPMYLKESILEQVRITQFPNRPPRLGGFFLCPTLDDIRKFRNTFPERQYVYTCKVEGGVNAILDLTLVGRTDSLLPIADQLNSLRQRAVQYWSGNRSDHPIIEVVTNGIVTIVEAVTL